MNDARRMTYQLVIEPDEDRFHAYCPELPDCRTWGDSEAEALQHLLEAVELYLESLIADGEPIPGIERLARIREICNAVVHAFAKLDSVLLVGAYWDRSELHFYVCLDMPKYDAQMMDYALDVEYDLHNQYDYEQTGFLLVFNYHPLPSHDRQGKPKYGTILLDKIVSVESCLCRR